MEKRFKVRLYPTYKQRSIIDNNVGVRVIIHNSSDTQEKGGVLYRKMIITSTHIILHRFFDTPIKYSSYKKIQGQIINAIISKTNNGNYYMYLLVDVVHKIIHTPTLITPLDMCVVIYDDDNNVWFKKTGRHKISASEKFFEFRKLQKLYNRLHYAMRRHQKYKGVCTAKKIWSIKNKINNIESYIFHILSRDIIYDIKRVAFVKYKNRNENQMKWNMIHSTRQKFFEQLKLTAKNNDVEVLELNEHNVNSFVCVCGEKGYFQFGSFRYICDMCGHISNINEDKKIENIVHYAH